MPATATVITPMLATGAIVFNPANYVQSTTIGMGGYAYTYSDGTSVACLNANELCVAGTTGAPASGTVYGAGVGVNLNEPTGSSTAQTIVATGSGISYALSALPTNTTILIDPGGVTYTSPTLTAASGVIPWTMFRPQTQTDGGPTSLSGAPTISHINFQISAGPTVGSFNFCITTLAFSP